jgi:archaellum component FlaF (FlaF/FlaG flagellin family)
LRTKKFFSRRCPDSTKDKDDLTVARRSVKLTAIRVFLLSSSASQDNSMSTITDYKKAWMSCSSAQNEPKVEVSQVKVAESTPKITARANQSMTLEFS